MTMLLFAWLVLLAVSYFAAVKLLEKIDLL